MHCQVMALSSLHSQVFQGCDCIAYMQNGYHSHLDESLFIKIYGYILKILCNDLLSQFMRRVYITCYYHIM